MNMTDLIKQHTVTISKDEAEKFLPLINTGKDVYVEIDSYAFVDKIIEKWFESKDYDFWDNPYPNVIEWSVDQKKGSIEFTYIEQNNKQ